jgi:carboxypeptidase T
VRARVLLALALLLALSLSADGAAALPGPGDALLVEVRPPDPAGLIADGLDLWETSADRSLALVTAAQADALAAAGRDVRVVRTFPVGRRKAAAAAFGPGAYRGYAAVVAELRAVAAARPDLVTLRDLGPSWETARDLADRRIWAARVTGPGAVARPGVLYLGAYHAREVVAPELALRTLRLFVDSYGRDPLLTHLVDTRELWIVPIVNPDGYARVEAGAEWWRKNGNPTASCGPSPGTSSNVVHPGVDLNRNHSFAWNVGGGASSEPCGETYQGPSAASEPETQAIQRLLTGAPFTTLISWHSYGNLVLWPWGYRAEPAGADPVLDALGGRLIGLTGYRGGPGGAALYLTTGELTDWAWGARGVGAITIEVGAAGDGVDGNPFTPPFRNVERYWSENKPAALYMARIGDSLGRAFAPDTERVEVSLPFGRPSGSVVATFAAGRAAAAELFVDAPGVDGAGQPGTVASNGATATWSLATAGLSPGRHGVFVRARDAAGRWGPLAATSVLVGRQSLLLPLGPDRAAVAP